LAAADDPGRGPAGDRARARGRADRRRSRQGDVQGRRQARQEDQGRLGRARGSRPAALTPAVAGVTLRGRPHLFATRSLGDAMPAPPRPRILSGMRPTGPLHLGHLVGALANWVKLQDTHACYFPIVDWHALTTDYADPSMVRAYVREVAVDWLAAGIDPERAVVFVQSAVQEHAALTLLLSRIAPLSGLERVPTYKEQQEQLRERDLATYGFLGYPLLQPADIPAYRPAGVPVGDDQVPHLELCREIARRF